MSGIESGALSLADMAFIETRGSNARRVRAAIWAYQWAQQNTRMVGTLRCYPSLGELRAALGREEWLT